MRRIGVVKNPVLVQDILEAEADRCAGEDRKRQLHDGRELEHDLLGQEIGDG
jgi:hypothetical protein